MVMTQKQATDIKKSSEQNARYLLTIMARRTKEQQASSDNSKK
jgi:hypothetical protein